MTIPGSRTLVSSLLKGILLLDITTTICLWSGATMSTAFS